MQKSHEWRQRHREVMISYLQELNAITRDIVLKGGTSLMLCYGLDRFSEDIDLDSPKPRLKQFTKNFCQHHGYGMRIAKDTDVVQRFMIQYGKDVNPLKIEVSYRNKNISPETYHQVHGISVYSIDRLAQLKAGAYQGRDKIRDLYDISFICNRYFDSLSEGTKNQIRDALSYKGFDNFDYILQTQSDPLINKDKLADLYLNMYDKLGLLYTEKEQELVSDTEKSRGTQR